MPVKLDPRNLSDDALALIASQFKVLSEPSRLRLLIELKLGERNVGQLVSATGITQVNVSRHLQALSDAGLVARRRDGVRAYYRIADDSIFTLCQQVCGSLQKRLKRQAKVAALFGE